MALYGQLHNGGSLNVNGSVISGPGHIVNAPGSTLYAAGAASFNVAVENNGTLVFSPLGSSAINGPLTTGPGSTIELHVYNGPLSLTVANGFTNHGLIS